MKFKKILPSILCLFLIISCKQEEPEEISAKESLETLCLENYGLVKSDSGSEFFASFRIKKTDNIANLPLFYSVEFNGKKVKSASTAARSFEISQPVNATGEQIFYAFDKTTTITFSYDENFSEGKKVIRVTPVVPNVSKAKFRTNSTSSGFIVSWDNNTVKNFGDLLKEIKAVITFSNSEKEFVATEIKNLNLNDTTLEFSADNSCEYYSVDFQTIALDGKKSSTASTGDFMIGQSSTYDASEQIWEIPTSQTFVSFENAANKNFYLIKTRTALGNVEGTRYVSSFSSPNDEDSFAMAEDFEEISKNSSRSIVPADEDEYVIEYFEDKFVPLEENPQNVPLASPNFNANFNADVSPVEPVEKIYKIGDKEQFYAATSKENSNTLINVTLHAKSEHCYAWIADDNYAEEDQSGTNKISANQVQKFVDSFEKIYELERYVFGNESDYLLGNRHMSEYSKTGTKVNLVFFDIYGDGTPKVFVAGYFTSGDYYYNYSKYNSGKFLYIDTFAASKKPEDTQSTLAHEFQHMINFSIKYIKQKTYSNTWFNEMCSMLAEDMLQEYLGFSDKDGPKSRIPYFNAHLTENGITTWENGDAVLNSYARAYAFGAYFTRKYGGAAFVKDLMETNAVDFSAMLKAVQMRESDATLDSIFADFASAVVNKTNSSSPLGTFQKDGDTTLKYQDGKFSYSYPMKGFDIWKYVQENNREVAGPKLGNAKESSQPAVPGYGFTIGQIGRTGKNQGRINIRLSSAGKSDSAIKTYIVAAP